MSSEFQTFEEFWAACEDYETEDRVTVAGKEYWFRKKAEYLPDEHNLLRRDPVTGWEIIRKPDKKKARKNSSGEKRRISPEKKN